MPFGTDVDFPYIPEYGISVSIDPMKAVSMPMFSTYTGFHRITICICAGMKTARNTCMAHEDVTVSF